jgi:hypothetical protein
MSVTFFIAPIDPNIWDTEDTHEKPTSDLYIDRSEFGIELLKQWPNSRSIESPTGTYWILNHDGDPSGEHLEVHLQADQQTIAFKPSPRKILIEFVLWYRAFVPASYPLYLFDDSSPNVLVLSKNTSGHEIIHQVGFRD